MDIETRIERYWNERSANFGEVRRRELESADAEAWREFITTKIPARRPLKILDVGTGAGFFAILLSRLGHEVIGIDMSREMLTQARLNAEHFAIRAEFSEMNAQKPDFDDEMFDVVISRNLTWTLPDVESAYREWRRVLKCGGVLLNFDSDYGDANFFNVTTCSSSGVNATQLDECGAIKDALSISKKRRPEWDAAFLRSIGFDVRIDDDISPLVHVDKTLDFDRIALFAIVAIKS